MSVLRLDDYSVPGHNLLISLDLPFKSADASGDSSTTAKASKGTKGKKLDVKLNIRFEEKEEYRGLVQVAELEENGEGKVFTITNETANLAGMRQARFNGSLKVAEHESLKLWSISFALEEFKSVPEQAAARTVKPGVVTQTNNGDEVGEYDPLAMATGGAETAAENAQDLGLFERFLKGVDDSLASDEQATGE